MAATKLIGVDTAAGDKRAVTLSTGASLSNNVLAFVPAGTQRIVASGVTTINSSSEMTLQTFTRNTNERVTCLIFISTFTDLQGAGEGALYTATRGMLYAFRTTTTDGQMKLVAMRHADALDHTFNWIIFGIVP